MSPSLQVLSSGSKPNLSLTPPKAQKMLNEKAKSQGICNNYIFYVVSWRKERERIAISRFVNSPLPPSLRGSLVPLCFLPLGWCHGISEVIGIAPGQS